MRGYLIDVNHVQAHFSKNEAFMSKIRVVPPQDLMRLSAITLGEITAGHEMNTTTDKLRRGEFEKFVVNEYLLYVMNVTATTQTYYGKIMGRIWKKSAPTNRRIGTDTHLASLGVNLNDVWLVASAWEHGLVVLTQDKMQCIRDASPEVQFDCWV